MDQRALNESCRSAVMSYDAGACREAAARAIGEGADLVDLIQSGFTAGMNEVGALYEAKKLFLPHVMAAANAMNAGVDVLAPHLSAQGRSAGAGLGTFVICTIEGDIHSIGKDIVAIMLKVAGFNVVNIGRDVPLAEIIKACRDSGAGYVGTSALMTSTMTNQKTLEEMLRRDGIRDKLTTNVGGAPVTQSWADEIGADIYTENASDAVRKMTQAARG